MDFIVGFPGTRKQNDSIEVVVDIITKFDDFIYIKSTYSSDYYDKIYIDYIVSLHGIPLSVTSYMRTVHI